MHRASLARLRNERTICMFTPTRFTWETHISLVIIFTFFQPLRTWRSFQTLGKPPTCTVFSSYYIYNFRRVWYALCTCYLSVDSPNERSLYMYNIHTIFYFLLYCQSFKENIYGFPFWLNTKMVFALK